MVDDLLVYAPARPPRTVDGNAAAAGEEEEEEEPAYVDERPWIGMDAVLHIPRAHRPATAAAGGHDEADARKRRFVEYMTYALFYERVGDHR